MMYNLSIQPEIRKNRKTRSDKKIRVNTPISQEAHENLLCLAYALDRTKTRMMSEIAETVLKNEELLLHFLEFTDHERINVQIVSKNEGVVKLKVDEFSYV